MAARSPNHAAFGWAIRQLRAQRELSQEEFGYLVGLHRNQVGSLERGEQNVTIELVFRVGEALGLPLSDLFGLYDARRATS